jgi:hypothetical protein
MLFEKKYTLRVVYSYLVYISKFSRCSRSCRFIPVCSFDRYLNSCLRVHEKNVENSPQVVVLINSRSPFVGLVVFAIVCWVVLVTAVRLQRSLTDVPIFKMPFFPL